MSQLYTPDTDVINAVDGAEWLGDTTPEWQYIEDVINQTERELDDALWDNDFDLAQRIQIRLNNLKASRSVGEEYVTNF